MTVSVITSVNRDIWSRYASKTISTWTLRPRIWWEPRDSTEKWQQWRERNQGVHPETGFKTSWQRFSHKVEAQCEFYRELKQTSRYMIWLDSDVRELEQPRQLEKLLPPEGVFCSYLGRGSDYHPETGWIAYDLEHGQAEEFFSALEEIYLSDQIFTELEWHDAWVWNEVCLRLGVPRLNLIDGHPQRGEAFARSRLKNYYSHEKGPRKELICGL